MRKHRIDIAIALAGVALGILVPTYRPLGFFFLLLAVGIFATRELEPEKFNFTEPFDEKKYRISVLEDESKTLRSAVEAQERDKAEQERRRTTPPVLNILIQRVGRNQLYLALGSRNLVPIRYEWAVNYGDRGIWTMQLEPLAFDAENPNQTHSRTITLNIPTQGQPEGVQVIFRYESMFVNELPVMKRAGHYGLVAQSIRFGNGDKDFEFGEVTVGGVTAKDRQNPNVVVASNFKDWRKL